ncbi:MAG: hypothetical protein KDA89_11920 [Planctomycetaceae bacterium]|nr:hypothetical protein [Planctomycetaceae bacterium]
MQYADDVSVTDRFWRQKALLRQHVADMISHAAENFITPGQEHVEVLQQKLAWQNTVRLGTIYHSDPLGHCVNASRMMRRT